MMITSFSKFLEDVSKLFCKSNDLLDENHETVILQKRFSLEEVYAAGSQVLTMADKACTVSSVLFLLFLPLITSLVTPSALFSPAA